MKKLLSMLLVLSFLGSMPPVRGEENELRFPVRNGSRYEKKIALTVDDFFDLSWGWNIRDMWHDLGVTGTFFPCGNRIFPEDRENWQKTVDYGIEIGSHNWGHYKMGSSDAWGIILSLGQVQQALDAALGYHYQIHCFRPPFGSITDEKGEGTVFCRAVKKFGYSHVILWDVSQTDPESALRKTRNGSILLFHARKKDFDCMQAMIPQLLEQGFEMVTVSELLGFGPNEISDEPYVYRKEDYEENVDPVSGLPEFGSGESSEELLSVCR